MTGNTHTIYTTGRKQMIIPLLGTLSLVHLLETLKFAQDEEDGLFLNATVEKILNEYEKLKELDPNIEILYREYQKEDIFNEFKI